jgi:superoxide dismutase, Cu-Zn family
MRRKILAGSVLVTAASILGCSPKEAPPTSQDAPSTTASSQPATTPPPNDAGAGGTTHRVDLMPGQGGTVAGALELTLSDGAVVMTGLVSGLKPGSRHGFHIHEKGDCSSPDFKSAGEHFNPTSQAHGDPASPPHHLGDVPNLLADDMGKAPVNARLEGVTLGDGGPIDLVGRAVVVHDDEDDYKTQPAGNSGDRIACGVIR